MTSSVASPAGLSDPTVPARWASRHFVAVIGLAVGLHAALLTSMLPAPSGSLRTPSAGARPVSVRTLVVPAEQAVPVERLFAAPPAVESAPAVAARPWTALHAGVALAARKFRTSGTSSPLTPVEPQGALAQPPEAPRPTPAAASPALQPAPDYLQRSSLDTPPHPLHDIDPAYPEEAQLRSGSVVVRLLIAESGDVDTAAVVRATPPGLFDASALTAFGSAKFAPGMRGGAPVKSQLTVEVEFTPMNRGAAVAGRSY